LYKNLNFFLKIGHDAVLPKHREVWPLNFDSILKKILDDRGLVWESEVTNITQKSCVAI
jgi:hypothetical protein